jgi:hypothetical protein
MRAAHSKTPTLCTSSNSTGTHSTPSTLLCSTTANHAAKSLTPSAMPGDRSKTAPSKQAVEMAPTAGLIASRPLPTTVLFVPTAALLAKARNSPPPPPPSVPCKVVLSRLNKPTAAQLERSAPCRSRNRWAQAPLPITFHCSTRVLSCPQMKRLDSCINAALYNLNLPRRSPHDGAGHCLPAADVPLQRRNG